jgi:hypothetical protein
LRTIVCSEELDLAVRLTSADLDDWSRRKDSEGHLPTLVRRLIMATVRPDWIRMPAAEGVALAGLDGVVSVSGGAPPYVPAGDSVWELGTNEAKRKKAVDDYEKRTKATPEEERAKTTYVCVLSRRWGSGARWVADMRARDDGWKDIVVLAADELALWLESCPGVEAWLREHLGMGSLGDIGISDWFARWSKQTDPQTPAGVLTAGRRQDAIRVLDAFDASPSAVPVAASSVEEAVAFVAAALLLGPGPDPAATESEVPSSDAIGGDADEPEPKPDPAIRRPETLEALRERTIVIEDQDGWRRWSMHAVPHILVPLFIPDSASDAIDTGHHVVLPQLARAAHQDGRLLPLDPQAATTAWQATGADFYRAQEYAFASRRNLGSLRRRLSRYGQQVPVWAAAPSASLLASMLLAGGWDAGAEGDQEVLAALAEHESWRALSKALVPLTLGEDPPLNVLEDLWDFVDVAASSTGLRRLGCRTSDWSFCRVSWPADSAVCLRVRSPMALASGAPTDATQLSALATQTGLPPEQLAQEKTRAFTSYVQRAVGDEILTPEEQDHVQQMVRILGIDLGAFLQQNPELGRHVMVAEANDGFLPEVAPSRLVQKRGEVVHLEVQATLLKDVTVRQSQGADTAGSATTRVEPRPPQPLGRSREHLADVGLVRHAGPSPATGATAPQSNAASSPHLHPGRRPLPPGGHRPANSPSASRDQLKGRTT